MHWMDLMSEPGLAETKIVSLHGSPCFSMKVVVEDFAVPSWNRVLAMHEMTRMRCRKLIHNIVAEAISGRYPTDLALLEYEVINRPTAKRKKRLAEMRKAQVPEYRRIKRFLDRGIERPKITTRPTEFNNLISLSYIHHRHKLLDVDNLCCKAFTDALVEMGLIPGDSPDIVVYVNQTQQKVPRAEPERVELDVLELPEATKRFFE